MLYNISRPQKKVDLLVFGVPKFKTHFKVIGSFFLKVKTFILLFLSNMHKNIMRQVRNNSVPYCLREYSFKIMHRFFGDIAKESELDSS